MALKKVLHIISEKYPFGKGEQFFDAEVKVLANHFDEIILFPLNKKGEQRNLPANVTINTVLAAGEKGSNRKKIGLQLPIILKILTIELRRSDKKMFILKKMRRWVSMISKSNQLATDFFNQIDNGQKNYFYSFWMNSGALLLAILKAKGKIDDFFFRVNGYDIFNERNEGNYLPFRYFNYKQVKHVFVLSQEALNYLKNLNCYSEKLVLNHYGIFDNGTNQLQQNLPIRIVSCANVIPLKRIDKIIHALSELTEFQVKWTHFGDGSLMETIRKQALQLPTNIEVDLRGNVFHSEIINTYEKESVNLFIHTSETEGLGMAIIEAQSYGIPAVVIGVGGVLDIVNEKTGAVLAPTAEGKEIAQAIREVLKSEMNSNDYRKEIQESCYEKFQAERNYRQLYSKMINE